MEKDAYYFPHFSNARNDRQIKRIRKQLGVEGYGIFFMVLEVLREQKDFKYPIEDIDLLSDDFNTSEEKINVVIRTPGLFELDEANFFSSKLILFLQPYLQRKEQGKKAALARWTNARALSEHCVTNTIKVKESKVNKTKLKEKKVKDTKINIYKGDVLSISQTINNKFTETYPMINLIDEYRKMDTWLLCNQDRRYKNYDRFANNWLSKTKTDNIPKEEQGLNVTQRAVLESRRNRLEKEEIERKQLQEVNNG